jgi:hypothetical protein
MLPHRLLRLLTFLTALLGLTACSEDFSTLFSAIDTEAFSQTQPGNSQPVSAGAEQNTPSQNTAAQNTPSNMPAMTILKHPQSLTVTANQEFALSVNVQSTRPVYYQWFKNNSSIQGATSATYRVSKARSYDQGFYHVVIRTAQQELRSLTARVVYRVQQLQPVQQVQPVKPLTLLQQPVSQVVSQGKPFTLKVSAQSSSALSYQWYRGEYAISGARSASYSVLYANPNDQGNYSVLIRNGNTSMRSRTALIQVVPPRKVSVELTWDTPELREDGSPLRQQDIQAYIIEFGRNYYHLDRQVKVKHQAINRYILQDIEPGLLYLRIATIDSSGFQGAFSQIISTYLSSP